MSELKPLYHTDNNGSLRVWKIWTEGKTIVVEYGHVDGKMQIARKDAEAKNVGTKAETTPEEQAAKEAKAMHKHKLQRKYSLTKKDAKLPSQLPMLAHKYEEKKKKVTWPCDIQPKLDGLRCLARNNDGVVQLTSRAGMVLNLPHICKELQKWMPDDMVLDGELYVHGVSLQTINSWIPKPGQSLKEESNNIIYNVYDVPMINGSDTYTWCDRESALQDLVQESEHVETIETLEVVNESDAMEMTSRFIDNGYEGGILRQYDGVYNWGHRSADLLKIKRGEDAEFEVVGYYDGIGKEKGKVCWICKNNDGTDNTFEVRPRGSYEERAKIFKVAESYIGRLLTVRFFGRTDKNIPFIPVGIVFRIDEDLPV
jgi:DNA ligase-1